MLQPDVAGAADTECADTGRGRSHLIAVVLSIAMGIVAIWRVAPGVRSASHQLSTIPAPSWPWVAVVASAIGVSYLFAALALQAAVGSRLPLPRTVLVQLAAAAANRVTPAGLGGAAVNARYLTRRGVTAGRAAAAVGLCGLAHIVVAAMGVAVLGPGVAVRAAGWFFGGLSDIDMLWVVAALLVALIARAVNLRTSRSPSRLGKSWVGRTATDARAAAGDVVGHPARLAMLITCTAAVKASNLLALYAALWAFDGDVATWRVAVVYLVGATAAEVVPTPAGLGTVDAALVAGLVTTGVGGGATLAAVIVYRLLSFWAPIVPGLIASAMLRRRLAL
ncbi:MAG TPA: lysylphosphatidylglycerol synthase transmembrane domain-containing protein [Acidothermaceae bacterium]